MELDLDKIKESQRNFNKKYGVKFKISEFDGQMRVLTEHFTSNPQNDWNTHYKSDFMKLLKEAFTNFVDFKISEFDPKKMLRDFEEMIMEPYRAECNEKRVFGPTKNADWSNTDFYKSVQHQLRDIPNDKISYATDRYLKWDLRVRHIRAFRERINNEAGFYSKETLSTLMCYKQALEHAVKNRTILFYIRHPFKSVAERTELNEVINCINQKTNRTTDSATQNEASEYNDAERVLNDTTISDIKQSVTNEIERSETVNNEKARVHIDSLINDDQNVRDMGVSQPVIAHNKDKVLNDHVNPNATMMGKIN